MMQKQDEERKALANIEKYAVQMKNIGEQEQTAVITAAALFQTIAALKQVEVVLRDAAIFWVNMASACTRLANNDVQKNIKLYQKFDAKKKRELYLKDNFKKPVVYYYAGWKALEIIAEEYEIATASVRESVMKDFGTYLSEEEARKTASTLGDQLLTEAQKEIANNKEYQALIEEEKTKTNKEAVAA